MFDLIIFYLFCSFSIVSALMVVCETNPVNSIFFLILCICNVVGILLFLGIQFLAFVLLAVYIGAIAVLFLFVIMMLNIRAEQRNKMDFTLMSIILILSIITCTFIVNETGLFVFKTETLNALAENGFYSLVSFRISEPLFWLMEAENLGYILYTFFIYLFVFAGIILLVAMIGAIVLTKYPYKNVRKQKIAQQISRTSKITFV